jgi:O-antigen/teichoic acid export membrane protein
MGVDVSAETAEHVHEQTTSVLTNSMVLLGSKVVTWALAFVMTIMLPRYLGAAGYGRLYFAISLTSVFAIMVEFGLNSLVSREISKTPEDTTAYLINAALLKAGLWVVAFAIMNAFVRIADYPPQTVAAVMILGLAIMITSMSSLLVAVLQATRHINWVAISSIAEKAVLTCLGVAALLAGYGMLVVAGIMLFSATVGLVLDLFWFVRLSRIAPVHAGWGGVRPKPLFVKALPFFSVVFLGAIYFRVDVIIMSLVKSSVVVGWYGASYRLFETTNLIPEAFMFAFFPVFCRMAVRGDNSLALATQKALDLLLLIGIPISVGMFTLAGPIIKTLYGVQFLPSVGSLRLLALATPLLYTNAAFVQLLVATDRQKKLAMTAGIAAVVNVGLNLLLIPRFGHIGAAGVTVVTEFVVTVVNYRFLPRSLTAELKITTPIKALAAAALMAVPLVLMQGQNVFVSIGVGVGVYLGAVVLVKALPAEDVQMMKAAVAGMWSA